MPEDKMIEDTYNLLNCSEVQEWYSKFIKKKDARVLNLLQNNKEHFLNFFGKQDTTITYEHRHWVWKRKFNNMNFIIHTGNKGTTYECILEDKIPTDETVKIMINFLEFILKIIPDKGDVNG